jgi:hypothetical protein
MSQQLAASGRDLTLQYTFPDGRKVVQTHRVWDADKFIETKVAEGRNPAAKAEDRFEIKVVSK